MKEFFYSLFANENFPMYLGLFIVILLIAFLIVFYWGKKDKELMETRKLEKIELEEKETKDAFKEKKEEPDKLEFEEEATLEMPKLADMPLPKDVPADLEMPKKKELNSSFEYTRTLELPKLNADSGVKVVNIEDFDKLADEIEKELDSLEGYKRSKKEYEEDEFVDSLYEETEEIELPKLR